ncbi:MAG: SMC-Scp complex subunit ScpB, partial [Parasphingorhabdus sp.]
TTAEFLTHFGLQSRKELPGIDDLKAAGLLDPVDLAMERLEMEAEEELPLEQELNEDGAQENDDDTADSLENEAESA